MDFSNFWWQAAEAPDPGGDAGDPIGQSLRFRGAQSLSGHSGGSGTASVWIKRGKLTTAQTVMTGIAFDAAGRLNASAALFRDPLAWLHVVVNADGTYVNGERVANGSAIAANIIGTSCDLYLAEFHFVDGQKLAPTTFGRYNANGVWVPVDPKKDGDTAWYGANGFHLTFADSGHIGKDISGNDNHFTATGFDTSSFVSGYWVDDVNRAVNGEWSNSQGQPYWIDVVPPDASSSYAYGAGNRSIAMIHDASDLTAFYTQVCNWTGTDYANNGNVESATFDLRDFTDIWDVAIFATGGTNIPDDQRFYRAELLDENKVAIPGTKTVLGRVNTAYVFEWFSLPISGTPRYVRIFFEQGHLTGVVMKGIRVNGQILSQVAQTTSNYDIMQDSPTNNFATINPLYPGASTSNANLTTANATGKPTILGLPGQVHVGGNPQAWDGTEAGWTFTGDVDFGQRLTPDEISTANMPAANLPDTITGTFTGNSSADGPFVYTGCIPARIQYGTIDVKYQDRLGQTNVDFLSNGFKVRSTTSNSGTVNYTVTTRHDGGEYDGNKVPFNSPAPAVSN